MNEQFRETDNITYTRQKMKTKQTEKKIKIKKTHTTQYVLDTTMRKHK
jgi:hypothetical protein